MVTPFFQEKVSARSMQRAKQDALRNAGVRVADSPGKGLGVYASRDFRRGKVITVYPAHAEMVYGDDKPGWKGWRVSQEYSMEHAWRMVSDYAVDAPGHSVAGDPDRRDEGVGHLINDGARCQHPGAEEIYRRVSHAKENTVPYTLLCGREFLIQMRATRDIEAGEELFFSYGLPYWRAKYGGGFVG